MSQKEALKLALDGGGLYEITGRIEDIDKCIVHRSVLKEALAQPEPPPECQTEAEKTAFAFGWFKALEQQRLAQPEQEPFETLAYKAEYWKRMHDEVRVELIKALNAQPEQELTNLERHKMNVQKFLGTPHRKEPEQEDYLSKAYRLANELRCHLAIAPAPQRTWVGLTDEEIDGCDWGQSERDHAKAVEAKLKEKNT